MQPLQRLFGKDIANLQEQPLQNKHSQHLRHNTRSFSLYGDFQHSKPNSQHLPNVSTRVQKPAFSKEEASETLDLREVLTDYFDESMGFMLSQQNVQMPLNNYLQKQGNLTESMRTVLLDWIVDIHLKFKMFPQTLFIVAAIIDRYLALKGGKKEELQLIGAAALFIGAKYEQTYQVPEASELVNISARVFTKGDLLRMQAEMIKALDFELVFNTPYHYLQPFCKLVGYQTKKFYLAQYILEMALLQARFLRYRSSLLAASTIYLVNKVKKNEVAWPDALVAASGYEQKELRGCARELCQLLQGAESAPNIKCLKRKFSLPKYCEVSKIRLQKKCKSNE